MAMANDDGAMPSLRKHLRSALRACVSSIQFPAAEQLRDLTHLHHIVSAPTFTELVDADAAEKVVGVLSGCLSRLQPKASACAVDIVALLASKYGLKVLSQLAMSKSAGTPRAQLAKLKLLSAAVVATPDIEQSPDSLAAVVRAQLSAFHVLSSAGHSTRFAHIAGLVLEGCMRKSPQLFATYADLMAQPANDDVAGPAVQLLLSIMRHDDARSGSANAVAGKGAVGVSREAWSAKLQPALVDAMTRCIFGSASRGPVTVPVLSFYGELLASLTQAQFSSALVPALVRGLKSRMDATLPIAAGVLLACTSVRLLGSGEGGEDDMSSLVTLALGQVGNGAGSEEARTSAIDLVRALCMRADAAPSRVVAGIADVLLKKKASVPMWQSRLGLTRALEAAVQAAPSAKTSSEALTVLLSAIPKETHDAVRCVSVRALGHALAGVMDVSAASVGEAISALVRGLQAYTPSTTAPAGSSSSGAGGAGAPLGDGFAEAVYLAVANTRTEAAAAAAATSTAAPTGGIAAELARSEELVGALICILQRASAVALAAKRPLAVHAAVPAVYAMAALQRLARVDPVGIPAKLSASKIAADGTLPSPAGASGTAATGKTLSAGGTSGAAKKGSITSSAAAGKPGASSSKPLTSASSASALLGLGAVKSFDVWDVLTSSSIAPFVLFPPCITGAAGRAHADVKALDPVLNALVDSVATAMSSHAEALSPYPSAFLTGVLSDLKGASAGDLSSASTASEGEDATATAAAKTPKTRTPGALFVGIVSLLTHPSTAIRRRMCETVQLLYSSASSSSSSPLGGKTSAEHNADASGSGAHSALPYALLHALFDRVRSLDNTVAPIPRGALEQGASPLQSGAGDAPAQAHALRAAALANGGKLLLLSSGGGGPDDGAAATSFSAAFPPPQLLQAAFMSIVGPLPSAQASPTFGPEAAVAVCLFLSCHPALAGTIDDPSGLSYLGSSSGSSSVTATAAGNEHISSTPSTSTSVGGSHAGGGADARGLRSSALWRAAYDRLVIAAGMTASPAIAASSSSRTAAAAANGAVLIVPTSQIDVLLQRESVGGALLAHLKGRWGMWSPSHTNRITAARMIGLIVRGTGGKSPQRAPSLAVTSSSDDSEGGGDATTHLQSISGTAGTSSGARVVFIRAVLPVLLEVLSAAAGASVTLSDAIVWAAEEGTIALLPDTSERGMWRDDMGDAGKPSANTKASRTNKKGNRMAEAEDDAWVAKLKEELAAKKAAAAAEERAAAAAKAGGRGPAAAAKTGAGAKSGGGKAALDEDPTASKLREQSATRVRVQAVYSAGVGALHALRAALTAAPDACQPLIPLILPALLPCLGVPVLTPHAEFCVAALIRSALACTSLSPRQLLLTPSSAGQQQRHRHGDSGPHNLPVGLVQDWTRALALLQRRDDSIAAASTGPAEPSFPALGGGFPAFEGHAVDSGAAASTLSPAAASALAVGASDTLGRTGADLSASAAVFKRLFVIVCPRLLPPGAAHGLGGVTGGAQGRLGVDSLDGMPEEDPDGRGNGNSSAGAASAPRCTVGTLPPPAFHCLFPILRSVLTASPPMAVLQPALALLAAHAVLPQHIAARSGTEDASLPALARSVLAEEEDQQQHDSSNSASAASQPPPAVWGVGGEACAEGTATPHPIAGRVSIALSASSEVVLPLGPSLADGSGSSAHDYARAGVRYAASVLAAYASLTLSHRAVLPSPSLSFPPTTTGITGFGTPSSDALAHRLLREPLVSTLLYVLRTAPRSMPMPDAVLLEAVRGTSAASAAAAAAAAATSGGSPPRSRSSSVGSEGAAETAGHSPTSGGDISLTMTIGESGPLVGESGLLSGFAHVRGGCLAALDVLLAVHVAPAGLLPVDGVLAEAFASAAAAAEPGMDIASLSAAALDIARAKNTLLARLWLSVHDTDEDNAAHADMLWARNGCALGVDYAATLLPLLSHAEESIRLAAGRALAAAVKLHPQTTEATLASLQEALRAAGEGMARTLESSWKTRSGVLSALSALAASKALGVHQLPIVLPFLIARGLPDEHPSVYEGTLSAGRALIDAYGDTHVRVLLPVLEAFLEKGAASPLAASSESARDSQREGVVILLGAAAKYLPPSDPKVASVLSTLIDSLNTPSEGVQRAASQCLPPLAKALKDTAAPRTLATLLGRLTGRDGSYAVRRGAAFGLAGCIKGFGLSALRAHDVMGQLEAAAGDSKTETAREGAMFAFETLCEVLGMLFEPYVIRVLPLLLKASGDGSEAVRSAAADASKAVMAILTGHGVKLVMPAVLKGFSESQWRSKQASIHMLGNMAYCAPKQLSQCLPQVVPRLCEAFEDPHPRVQAAGRDALQDIGKVIKNPEIMKLVPALLGALADPAERTKDALLLLSNTDFVHAIDPASLALIVPILRRGLLDRSASTKVSAALIVGNMCSLIADPRDVVPYLPVLLPALKKAVVDPIPDVRATSARGMGSLLRGLGEAEVADLLPWLISTLKEEGNSTVERSGAAQGLAEVLVALGMDRLADCVVDLLPLSGHAKPGPREGLLWLLVFLPSSLGKECALLIPRTLPIILQLLSDDMEVVRDVALRAGQVYVKMFSRTDAQLLAGPLEAGLFSLSWRIRQASVKLVGQMLAEIAGTPAPVIVAGNVEDAFEEDEDEDGEERGRYDEDSASESDDEEDKGAEGADGPSSPPFADPKARLEAAAAAAAAVARGGAKPSGGSPSPTGGASSPPPPSEEGADATGKGKRGGDFYGKKKGPEKPVAQGRKKLTEEEKDARDRSNKREDRSAAPPPGRGGGGGGGGGKRPSNNPAATRKPVMDEHYVAPSQLDAASQAVVRVLGNEGRARILASMYAVRCDVSVVVRQSALKVWKDTVQNTPKTLREVLPALMRLIIAALAMDNAERRLVAGRALGEVVRKLGDRVLPEIVPMLRRGLASDSPSTRQGVCLGLAEVIESATRKQIEGHIEVLIPAVRDALSDASPPVRVAAARAFNTLQRCIGQVAVDQTVPALLAAVDTPDAEKSARALAGLQSIVALRPKEILPFLLPRLIAPPLSEFHARTLAGVATVVRSLMHFQMTAILPAVVSALAGDEPRSKPGSDAPEAVTARLASPLAESCASVVQTVEDAGVAWTVGEIVKYFADPKPARRRVSAWLLGRFVGGTDANVTTQVPMMLKELIGRLVDTDEDALRAGSEALTVLASKVPVETLAEHLDFIRSCLNSLVSEARFRRGGVGAEAAVYLPGLCLPKGIDALLLVYQRALMHGNAEERETAAIAIGELVEMTSPEALKPSYVKITGPLIRIVADKFPWSIKAAILHTLGLLIDKGGASLKPFQPQLQSTFVKALSDPTQAVRSRGAVALGKLQVITTRVDPLVNELIGGITGSGDSGIQESMCEALAAVLLRSGDKASPAVREKVIDALCETLVLGGGDDTGRRLGAGAIGAALRHADAPTVISTLERVVMTTSDDDEGGGVTAVDPIKDGRALTVNAILRHAPGALARTAPAGPSLLAAHLRKAAQNESADIRAHAAKGLGYFLSYGGREYAADAAAPFTGVPCEELAAAFTATGETPLSDVVSALARLSSDPSSDVRRGAADAVKRFARHSPRLAVSFAGTLLPPLIAQVSANTGNAMVRAAADSALLYLTQCHGPAALNEASLASVTGEDKAWITDHQRKQLKRMPVMSGEDTDDDADM